MHNIRTLQRQNLTFNFMCESPSCKKLSLMKLEEFTCH